MIIGQIAGVSILNYEEKIIEDKNTLTVILNISKKLFRETLKISNMIYYGINNKDLFNKSGIEYSLTDELHLSVGVDVFEGDKGLFGQYKDNTEAWVKAKYSF